MKRNSPHGGGGFSALVWLATRLLPVVVLGCRPDADIVKPAPTTGSVALHFAYGVGTGQPFYLDSAYLTTSDELVRISRLKYYVSRVRLQRADSSYWTAPDRAFLLDAGHRDSLLLAGVPDGEYGALSFDIGLDSITNSRTDWGGDLAPAHEMFWAWNTGYKFFSLDGQWLGAASPALIEYHIGREPTRRTIHLPLPQPARVAPSTPKPRIELAVRPLTAFGGPNTMRLGDSHDRNVMFDTSQALRVVGNYVTMFQVSRVR